MDKIEEAISLDENLVISNIKKYSSIKLADFVITYRHFGLFKDISLAAMEELGQRRLDGDTFDYEKYIDDNIKALPKLDFSIPDISSILKEFGKKGFMRK